MDILFYCNVSFALMAREHDARARRLLKHRIASIASYIIIYRTRMFMIHSKFVCAPAFYTVEFILTNDLSLMIAPALLKLQEL